jgi:predicted nucleotidyltransferase component of viral defense system
LSDDLPADLREVVNLFRLPGVAPVAKDFHVVAAIAAIAATDSSPYALVFGGGTALARAHRLVQRMSEDVDFKIVPLPTAPTSRNGQRRALGDLTDRVTVGLQAAGFAFDPADPACTRSRNENRYTIWHLPYASPGHGLRPTIQIELTYAPMRRPTVSRAVSSFVAEALNRPPEVPSIACVSITETAAEKVVALTRRVPWNWRGSAVTPTRR